MLQPPHYIIFVGRHLSASQPRPSRVGREDRPQAKAGVQKLQGCGQGCHPQVLCGKWTVTSPGVPLVSWLVVLCVSESVPLAARVRSRGRRLVKFKIAQLCPLLSQQQAA